MMTSPVTSSLKSAISVIAVASSLYHLYTAAFGIPAVLLHRSLHLTFMLVLTFLVFPLKGDGQRWYWWALDWALALVSLITLSYVSWYHDEIAGREGLADPVTN